MPSLGWALLEHLVWADVWARTSINAAAQPTTALVLFALVTALMLAITHTVRAILLTLLRLAMRPGAPLTAGRPDDIGAHTSARIPVGGMGPRAPGQRSRRRASIAAPA
ncbi:hypothetical protein ACFOYW_00415 [Gryllotalpicola reticulitermitis]|uniref:Uncharacterized protein n=1 Tax=Gryllotalpicola reticulitermitis TaxID=1184153 RepID=A0ABV8Q2E4_9MICO